MSEKDNENDMSLLQQRMRADWDCRVAHDYRYWMSDGVESDQAMWEAGERDFGILTAGLDPQVLAGQGTLEVGCGVGRLLRAASSKFAQVIGIDVSDRALTEARRLLSDRTNVSLVTGNGTDLQPLASGTIDFAYSFAALSSMPVSVIARYLVELSRVVKQNGKLRLQVYLGREQDTVSEDSIAIRSFARDKFLDALQLSGFATEAVAELKLPFSISDYQQGLVAHIISLKRVADSALSPDAIERILSPHGEKRASDTWRGSHTAYLMAIARAKQLLDAGRVDEAKTAATFALQNYQGTADEVTTILKQASPRTPVVAAEDLYQNNLAVIKDKFPELYRKLLNQHPAAAICSVRTAASGEAVVVFQEQALDNVEKPRRAAQIWVERTILSPTLCHAKALVVVGFATGYHLEFLLERQERPLHLIEPRLEVLRMALSVRDCTALLQRLASFSTTVEEFHAVLAKHQELENSELLEHPQTKSISAEAIDEFRRELLAGRGLRELRPTIAVIGPMYGGSLPIAGYVTGALRRLRQRVHGIDVSGFYSPYQQTASYFRDSKNVDLVQNRFIDMLSNLILQSVLEKKVDIVIALAQAPLTGEVLTEMRKRGIITAMWFVEDFRRFLTWRELSRYYDYMFMIQDGECLKLVDAAGAGRASYLPVGCDAQVHAPVVLSAEERLRWGSQVSFVGAGYNNRRHIFAGLSKMDFKIWGTEWPAFPPFDSLVQEQGRRLTPDEYVKIFNASVINLNLHSSSERDGIDPHGDFVNPRTFELPASGAFQLVDERKLLPQLFVPGKEIATFSSIEEMREKIDYYLQHADERAAITFAGRERALREHSYMERLRTLLGCIYADKFQYLNDRQQRSPWPTVLSASAAYPDLQRRFEKVYERGGEPQLQELVDDIQIGKGTLTDAELKVLFLHHIKTQVTHVTKLRKGE